MYRKKNGGSSERRLLWVSILPLSTIFRLDFGTVQTVCYFGTVQTVCYFGTVQTVCYFGTVQTVCYFRTVQTVWYYNCSNCVLFFVYFISNRTKYHILVYYCTGCIK